MGTLKATKFDLAMISRLATENVSKGVIIAHFGGDRSETLIKPSFLKRAGNKIIIRCEGVYQDVTGIEVRLNKKTFLTFLMAARDLPFGIELELLVRGPVFGYAVGKK